MNKIHYNKYYWKALESNEETTEKYKETPKKEFKAINETEDLNTKWRIFTETLVKTTEE